MSCKDVKTQVELDEALADESVTCVHIKSESGAWIEVTDNEGRTVEAYDSSTVTAYGSSTVTAYDSSTVTAYDSSTVTAYDSSTVTAYGSSTVTASGSSTVRARDRVKVTASQQVAVHLHSAQARVAGGVVIDVTQLDLDDAQAWCDHHGADVVDGRVTLFKALPADLTAGRHYDKPTLYEVGTELVAVDWVPTNRCGGGLHLSPSPHQAAAYQSNPKRYVRCSAAIEDVRPINDNDSPKVKVRALRVEAEVDAFARELAAIKP